MSMPLVSGLSVIGRSSHTSVKNYVVVANWKDLQVMPFGPLTPDNVIDQWLAVNPDQINKPNFHVRLNFGRYSPDFAALLTGAPALTITDPQDGNVGQVPIWWDDSALILAQANLVTRLADKYDGLIPAIYMATNMTIYAEPYQRQMGSKANRAAYTAAGYTTVADVESYHDCLSMFEAFQETRVAWAFNPYTSMDSTGAVVNDVDFTIQMMYEMRKRFSTNGIVQNNSIRYPELPGDYPTMYNAMKGMKPLNFQTATMARVGNLTKTLDWAVMMGANRVELNPGYETHLSAVQISNYDKALRSNAL